jgi:hypothetical protein
LMFGDQFKVAGLDRPAAFTPRRRDLGHANAAKRAPSAAMAFCW